MKDTLLAQSMTFPGSKEVPGYTVNGKLKFNTIGDVLNGAVPYIFVLVGIGLLVMLVASGFTYLTSAGDAKKLESAKQRILNALTGFLIIFLAYWLVQIAGYVLGLQKVPDVFK